MTATILLSLLLAPPYFVIRVVDAETGRGVPLIELRISNEVRWVTDSAGIAAIHEPGLEGGEVFFRVRGHGYEFPEKFFEEPGLVLKVEPGKTATVEVRRKNIAERLYRVTGQGTYRDSVLAGLPVPLQEPLMNGKVLGQDTVSATIYRGRIFWIWGDTVGPRHWNFAVAGATSELPGQGGLDPSAGVDLHYLTNKDGFAGPILPLQDPGLVWIEGLFTAKDPEGEERLLATYTRQPGLTEPLERGVALFNDQSKVFERWVRLPWLESHISSHPFKHREGSQEYWYMYPWLRVPNEWDAIRNPERWERRETQLPEGVRTSSVQWNAYRKKWILLAERVGEVFYAEGDRPEGPFSDPVRALAHDDYNFYNVAHHPFFDQEGGRVIYFEGTYTAAFSSANEKTPRYDYNQVMYRLRLDDPRLH